MVQAIIITILLEFAAAQALAKPADSFGVVKDFALRSLVACNPGAPAHATALFQG
jgi:hypothetical protein